MIFSNKKYLDTSMYNENIKKAFEFCSLNKIEEFEPGSYEIDGQEVFVNIVHYETKTQEERFWEAHKKYLDIHVVFSGNEKIDLAFIDDLKFKNFVEQDDFVSFEGEKKQSIVLRKDDFLILYPEDVHMTCLIAENKELVKKAIFKVRI
ncbi:MAG: YhcH/YjgK/YiaL family protein [Sarcina sp.]